MEQEGIVGESDGVRPRPVITENAEYIQKAKDIVNDNNEDPKNN
jgi:hypothetical protein